MKIASTLILKVIILLFAAAVLALCFYLTYALINVDLGGYRPIVIGMLFAAVPFFVGAFQTFKLLNYIDQKKAFTNFSIKALKKIKFSGLIISAIYGLGLPYIFIVANQDDAPGVVLLGLIFTFTPMMIAVFASVIQLLLQNAIDLKSENDLTV